VVTITLQHPSNIILRDSSLTIGGAGVCWDGTNWFVVKAGTKEVYKYDSDFTYVTFYNLDAGQLVPYGIEWDGTSFFVTDGNANVYQYNSDFSVLEDTHDVGALGGNDDPRGICWDGSAFFITDTDANVYKYPSDFLALTTSYDIGALGGNDDPFGVCWDATYFWVIDNTDGSLYQYPSDFSALTASYDIGALGGNDAPYGIDYDNTYHYVADIDGYIYKYEYVPDEDITSKVKSFFIDHSIKQSPTAVGEIFNTTVEYDDKIKVTGIQTAKRLAHPLQNGVNYKDSLHFRSDTIGAFPTDTTQGAWTDSDGAGTDSIITDKFNGHSYVLAMRDESAANAPSVKYSFTGQTDGSIEFWIAVTDTDCRIIIYWRDEGNGITSGLRIKTAAWEYYDDGAAFAAMGGTAPVIGKWYRVTYTFDCDTDKFSITIVDEDDTAIASVSDKGLASSPTTIDVLQMLGNAANEDYIVYFDAIGFTWDSNYTLGDNANLEVSLSSQTLFEGRAIEEGSEHIKTIPLVSLSIEGSEAKIGEQGTAYNPDGYAHIANYSEEVVPETINAKCSDITATLTDEIYRGSLTFENDTDATFPVGFVDKSTIAASITVDATGVGSHKYVLKLNDTDNATKCDCIYYFERQESGTIEVWIYSDDVTKLGQITLINDLGTGALSFNFDADDTNYHDGGWNKLDDVANATWYRIRIDFECGAGGYEDVDGNALGTDEYSITQYGTDGVEDAQATTVSFSNNCSYVVGIQIKTEDADDTYSFYVDAIGFSWDSDYTIGDNKHIYIHDVQTGSNTIDFSIQGEHYVDDMSDTIADLEGYIWYYTGDHKWIFNDGTLNNTISLTKYCQDVNGTNFLERYNDIIIKCGWNAGSRVYGTASNSDSKTTYGTKTLPCHYSVVNDTSTTANSIATSVLAFQENTPKIRTLGFRNTNYGMFQPGETIPIPASTIYEEANNSYLDAGNWLITKVVYDCILDMNILTLSKTLFYMNKFKLGRELETLANG
jgi:hypothetical protein